MLHPTFAIRVPHKESQEIHSTQQLSGSALSLDIHASTFANLTGNPSEKRNITSLTDSELKFNRPFVKDVTLEAVFKRAEYAV